jgi:hypothetical protein
VAFDVSLEALGGTAAFVTLRRCFSRLRSVAAVSAGPPRQNTDVAQNDPNDRREQERVAEQLTAWKMREDDPGGTPTTRTTTTADPGTRSTNAPTGRPRRSSTGQVESTEMLVMTKVEVPGRR